MGMARIFSSEVLAHIIRARTLLLTGAVTEQDAALSQASLLEQGIFENAQTVVC